MELKDIAELNKKEKSGFKQSGILLQKWVHKKIPFMIKYPEASTWDFHYKGNDIDVKGCHQSKYNGCIFIETVQNIRIGSIPSHMKNTNVFFIYVDYDTGEMFLINWNKLYNKIKNEPQIKGGYEALGFKVHLNQHEDCIKRLS
jgi:hypothetical protein